MKRILAIVLSTALFASCGSGGNDDAQYVDSTNVTPNSEVNPEGSSGATNMGEGAGLDTNSADSPGLRTNPGVDSARDTSR